MQIFLHETIVFYFFQWHNAITRSLQNTFQPDSESNVKANALQQTTQMRRPASALALLAAMPAALFHAVAKITTTKRGATAIGKQAGAMFVSFGISAKCHESRPVSSKFYGSNWEYSNNIRGIRSQVATG